MMMRKANPSARIATIAATASRVLVIRAGTSVPRSGSPAAGPVNESGLLNER